MQTCIFILFCFFYFVLYYFILFYFILFHFILFVFLFYFSTQICIFMKIKCKQKITWKIIAGSNWAWTFLESGSFKKIKESFHFKIIDITRSVVLWIFHIFLPLVNLFHYQLIRWRARICKNNQNIWFVFVKLQIWINSNDHRRSRWKFDGCFKWNVRDCRLARLSFNLE